MDLQVVSRHSEWFLRHFLFRPFGTNSERFHFSSLTLHSYFTIVTDDFLIFLYAH